MLAKVARHQSISYGEFYFKRSMRILPAYLVVLAFYFTIPGFSERSVLPPLWRFLTFTQNYGLNIATHAAFSHAWSLCIEEQFYLGLPLIILALTALDSAHRAVWILPALFLLGFALRLYNWFHFIEPILQNPEHDGFTSAYYRWIYYPAYTRLDGLLAGVTLAAIYHFRPRTWQRISQYGNLLLLTAFGLLAAAWWMSHEEYQYSFRGAIFGYPLISIAYGVLVLAALSPSCILYRYPSRLSAFVAALSYTIYLTHKQILHLSHQLLDRWLDPHGWVVYVICIFICVLAGWFLRVLIELPFLRLRDRLLAKKPTAENKLTL